MIPAIVVLDANLIHHLDRDSSVRIIVRNERAAHLSVWPSVINVFEVLKHPNDAVQSRLLRAIRTWVRDRPLLPWPPTLLRLDGEAALRGEKSFIIRSDELDYLVHKPKRLSSDRAKATEFVDSIELAFNKAHSDVRNEVQRELKRAGLRDAWASAREYLERAWVEESNLRHFAQLIWQAVDLPGDAPFSILAQREVWRLALEAFGTAMFDRAIRVEQRRNPPSQLDLFQLLYLTVHTRSRIFVTDDQPLQEAANAVLRGRYQNVRVLSSQQFLDC